MHENFGVYALNEAVIQRMETSLSDERSNTISFGNFAGHFICGNSRMR